VNNGEQSNNIQAAIDAGKAITAIGDRIAWFGDDDGPAVPIVTVNGNATLHVDVLKAIEERRDRPTRKRGTLTLTDVVSFIEAVNRWKRDLTVIYADADRFRLEAVIDEHPPNDPQWEQGAAWRQDRIVYTCPRSSEWLAWTAVDGIEMPQAKLGDFLESRLEDLVAADGCPKPLEMLEVARKLTIRTKGEFTRQIDPTTGNNVLVSKTENTSESTPIPRAFRLAIPVFDGGVRYEMEARVRLRVEGAALFTIVLHRRKEIERDAFNAVRRGVADETKRLVLAGVP
jgi:uncharacterized protein YfdQ (DUF2303 family)